MALVVQKYGGSSVADAAAIKRVAHRIVAARKDGADVVVAVSAMGDTTDNLLELANQVTPLPGGRELDMLLTSGERISMALLAMAVTDLGFEARSFTGSQAGVITDSAHGRAHIIDVTPGRIRAALDEGAVVIVAGFQGVSRDTKDITTLGRGGSDTTAVALAAALDADVCEIYTDVDGVFTADPRIVGNARRLATISYEEMLEMAACGTKVLHLRSVEYARRYAIPIHVRSSFSDRPGTIVSSAPTRPAQKPDPAADPTRAPGTEELETGKAVTVEEPIIAGVSHDRGEAKITLVGVPDVVGRAAEVFSAVAAAQINIDMIVQNAPVGASRLADISFTLPTADVAAAVQALDRVSDALGYGSLVVDDQIGKVSLIGAGMRSSPGVSATFFTALAGAGINIGMISTSEIRISVVVAGSDVDAAVAALHTAFGLDAAAPEAVVYAGTGR